jgi:hypothetical protein
MRKFTWDEWTDVMKDAHNVLIPETIEFQLEGSKNEWAHKRTRDATLDELTTAVINLDDEIKRLNQIRGGLMAVQTRARRTLRTGPTLVHDALVNPYAPDSSYDFDNNGGV